jgi:outer membrane biosynthesis protein TonB
MAILNTKHKQQSAAITAGILLLLILGIFNLGLDYLDPPAEYGVAINYGDAAMGSGVAAAVAKKSTPKKSSMSSAQVPKETSKEGREETMLMRDASKTPFVLEKVTVKKTADPEVLLKEEQEQPKPSKENQEALAKLLSGNRSEEKKQGEGLDAVDGSKGAPSGVLEATKYYGNAGSASNENYNLSGRKVLETPKKQPNCQEEGIVVVQITVDKSGKVVSAVPGVKGTTNTAPCLAKPAKEAALSTRWNADAEAPIIQTGTIIYKFTLSK